MSPLAVPLGGICSRRCSGARQSRARKAADCEPGSSVLRSARTVVEGRKVVKPRSPILTVKRPSIRQLLDVSLPCDLSDELWTKIRPFVISFSKENLNGQSRVICNDGFSRRFGVETGQIPVHGTLPLRSPASRSDCLSRNIPITKTSFLIKLHANAIVCASPESGTDRDDAGMKWVLTQSMEPSNMFVDHLFQLKQLCRCINLARTCGGMTD